MHVAEVYVLTSLERLMRIVLRCASLALAIAIVLASPLAVQAQSASELHGGWTIRDWQAPEGQTGPTPQRGLFLFTESGQYSIMYVIGDDREPVGAAPTDAEIAAAYGPFIANSGRYAVSGDEITYEAFVAKDPAYMANFEPTGGEGNAQTMIFSIEDGTLTLSFGEGGPMGGATATLRRPGT